MQQVTDFLMRHGYAVLTLAVFGEQIGLPVPSLPVLLAAGALAGSGQIDLGLAVGVSLLAALAGDLAWFGLGRRRGGKVLNLLCRISLEPDSCVRKTEELFARHGARSLLFSKFLPGFSIAAPPLAGMFHMRLDRFLIFDSLGALLWAGSFLGLGYLFSDQLERVAETALDLGGWLAVVLVGGLALYIAWKYVQRQRFLHQLRVARISPEELKRRLDGGEEIVVVDLRHRLDFEVEPEVVPGAVHLTAEELEARHAEIPRDREIVLYCT